MGKRMISLILSDEVLEAADRLAYRSRTSRSEMINRLLGQALGVETPGERLRRMIEGLNERLCGGDTFLYLSDTGSTLCVTSALAYKYHPTVKYTITPGWDGKSGQLRVSMRTRNESLLSAFEGFLHCFVRVEMAEVGTVAADYRIEPGQFCRSLLLPELSGGKEGIAWLSAYLHCFDDCMKRYFALIEHPTEAMQGIKRRYDAFLQEGVR